MTRLTIGIEVEILARPRPTGVERALRRWLTGLAGAAGVRVVALSRSRGIDLPSGVEAAVRPSPLPLAAWRELHLPRLVRRTGVEVLLSPVTAIPLRAPVPVVATIHELPWLERGVPGTYRRERWRTGLALRRADIILTVSAAAARQVLAQAREQGRQAPPIRVVRHGFPPPPAAPAPPTEKRGPEVVTISAHRPRKNLPVHLEAFARLAPTLSGARYTLVGPGGRDRERLAALAAGLGVGDLVDLPGYLGDAEVDALLRRSAILLHAPLSEGFGFTPLEALARGCVPLVSRRGALAEVSGPAAFYVDDPADPGAVARVLGEALGEPAARRQRLDRAAERLHRRDPDKAIRRLVAVCEEAARRGGRR